MGRVSYPIYEMENKKVIETTNQICIYIYIYKYTCIIPILCLLLTMNITGFHPKRSRWSSIESRHGLVSKASQEQAQELMFAELLRMEMVTVYTMESHYNQKKNYI